MSVTLRALPTAYEPGGAALTVATPSCCCCCCCANTMVATTALVGAIAYGTAERHGRPRWLILALALSMLPIAVLTVVFRPLRQADDIVDLLVNLGPGFVFGAIVAALAFRFAGLRTAYAGGFALAIL